MKPILGSDPSFVIPDVQLHIVDVLWPAIAGRSAGPEAIAPAVVMDSLMCNCTSGNDNYR
jgi:hypothetical protein